MSKPFFELEDFSAEGFTKAGYTPRWVSLFDHWLSAEEADACTHLFYGQAIRSGLEDHYLEQETRFFGFYRDLLSEKIMESSAGTVTFYEGWQEV